MADYFATMRASENGLASLRHLDETRLSRTMRALCASSACRPS